MGNQSATPTPDTLSPTLALAQALVRCPSVTPAEGGALDLCQDFLTQLGFACWRLPFGDGAARVDNLFARFGKGAPHFCFAGHTDVVPVGDEADWTHPPFSGTIQDNKLHGRGAEDMKGNVAAALQASAEFLGAQPDFAGSISFLLTGDEEGPAIHGTKPVLAWMEAQGHVPDFCLVIEPTASATPGDTLKVGRRGSLNGTLTVTGQQGHVAYPDKAQNPLPYLVSMLDALVATPLDDGTPHFQASSLQLTSVDVGNAASNVIPAAGQARFNVRFNDLWTPETLLAEIKTRLSSVAASGTLTYDLESSCNAVAFMTPPEKLADPLAAALAAHTGTAPAFSTAGGTSDARFVQAYCPVAEMGLVGKTMHQVDEHIPLTDLETLRELYGVALSAMLLGETRT